jgi:hypothetical protein
VESKELFLKYALVILGLAVLEDKDSAFGANWDVPE